MTEGTVIVEQGEVARVTINRPGALNSLNWATLSDLLAALEQVGTARVVILTGAGEKAFVAGADIAEMSQMTPREARRFAELGHAICDAIEEHRAPFIAAVNGFALGGGCELALACDFVYASSKARFGQPEVNLGLIPGFGGTQRLGRRVGQARARELIYTGDIIGADEALRVGLVNKIFPAAELMAETKKCAEKIASKGPLAIAYARRAVRKGAELNLPAGNDYEAELFALLFATADQKEGMDAFLNKRSPNFRNG